MGRDGAKAEEHSHRKDLKNPFRHLFLRTAFLKGFRLTVTGEFAILSVS